MFGPITELRDYGRVRTSTQWLKMPDGVYKRDKIGKQDWGDWELTPMLDMPFIKLPLPLPDALK